jgi:single-stranded DNA-binding protein
VAADPQVNFPPSGKRITKITILVCERRQNGDREWVDGESA